MEKLPDIDVTAHFPELNRELIQLLKSLSPEQWNLRTSSKRWVVKDIVAHLLDGDLRRLSFQRDHHQPPEPDQPITDYNSLVRYLNRLNDIWFQASQRLSPPVLIELLEYSGKQLAQLFRSLDHKDEAQFGVLWAGEEKSVNWFDIAREYTEKWYHQQQIREAVGAPLLISRYWLFPVVDTFMRGLPHAYNKFYKFPERKEVSVRITGEGGGEWLLVNDNGWGLYKGFNPNSDSVVEKSDDTAWRMFTKNLSAKEALLRIRITGDKELGETVCKLTSLMK
ncbi:MAG: maleylpyruvate isomerase N-terminal domain-containing protein [Calditrichaceae bacterium]